MAEAEGLHNIRGPFKDPIVSWLGVDDDTHMAIRDVYRKNYEHVGLETTIPISVPYTEAVVSSRLVLVDTVVITEAVIRPGGPNAVYPFTLLNVTYPNKENEEQWTHTHTVLMDRVAYWGSQGESCLVTASNGEPLTGTTQLVATSDLSVSFREARTKLYVLDKGTTESGLYLKMRLS
jgi:hypothetical protein